MERSKRTTSGINHLCSSTKKQAIKRKQYDIIIEIFFCQTVYQIPLSSLWEQLEKPMTCDVEMEQWLVPAGKLRTADIILVYLCHVSLKSE